MLSLCLWRSIIAVSCAEVKIGEVCLHLLCRLCRLNKRSYRVHLLKRTLAIISIHPIVRAAELRKDVWYGCVHLREVLENVSSSPLCNQISLVYSVINGSNDNLLEVAIVKAFVVVRSTFLKAVDSGITFVLIPVSLRMEISILRVCGVGTEESTRDGVDRRVHRVLWVRRVVCYLRRGHIVLAESTLHEVEELC